MDRIVEFLQRYPYASVDLAARLVHLQLQASKGASKVRNFFVKFQDRILYATDLTRLTLRPDDDFANDARATWLVDWRFLTTDAPMQSTEFSGAVYGLALPREVVDKIYQENARRVLPGGWR